MAITAEGDLQYRKNERTRGVVCVRGATIDTEPAELRGLSGGRIGFAIRQAQRTYFLAAESTMEFAAWLEALQEASAATPRRQQSGAASAMNSDSSDGEG